MLLYLDSSAWNKLADGASIDLPGEVLFSSCNLDEFGGADRARQQRLAQLAWDTSNRKKLRDHVELMHTEVSGNPVHDNAFSRESRETRARWGQLTGGRGNGDARLFNREELTLLLVIAEDLPYLELIHPTVKIQRLPA